MYNKTQVKEIVHVTQKKHRVSPNTTILLQFISYMFRPFTWMVTGLRAKREHEVKTLSSPDISRCNKRGNVHIYNVTLRSVRVTTIAVGKKFSSSVKFWRRKKLV